MPEAQHPPFLFWSPSSLANSRGGGGVDNWVIPTGKQKNQRISPLLELIRHVTKKETRTLPSFLLHRTRLPQLTQQPVPWLSKLINTFWKTFTKQILLDWIKKYVQLFDLLIFRVLQPQDKGCLWRFLKQCIKSRLPIYIRPVNTFI